MATSPTVDAFQLRLAMGMTQRLGGNRSAANAAASYTAQRVQQGALCPPPRLEVPFSAPTRPPPVTSPLLLWPDAEPADAAPPSRRRSPTKSPQLRGSVSAPDLTAPSPLGTSPPPRPRLPPLPRVTVAIDSRDLSFTTDVPGHGRDVPYHQTPGAAKEGGGGDGAPFPESIVEKESAVLSPRPLGLRRSTDHEQLIAASPYASDPHTWYMRVFPSRNPSGCV